MRPSAWIITTLAVLCGCYQSHELYDGAAPDDGGAPRDGGEPPPMRDAGLLFACGGLLHDTPGCFTFLLPQTEGTTTCIGPSGRMITGPTFVTTQVPGDSTSVSITSASGPVTAAYGSAIEPCDVCSWGDESSSDGVTGTISGDSDPIRFVVGATPDGRPFNVHVCSPGMTP